MKELMRLSKDQLAKACRNQGLSMGGDKADLVARLAVSEEVEPKAPPPEEKGPEEPGGPEAPPEVD